MKVQTTLLALSSLLSLVSAIPAIKRDSAINEPGVAAPNGTPVTLTGGAAPTAPPAGPPAGVDNSNSCSSGDCGSKPDMSGGCNGGDCNSKPDMSGCSSGDCGQSSSMMMDTTTMMAESTSSTMMAESTSSSMWESTSTMTAEATSTWSSSYAAPTYGSGYAPNNYDSCVQQCMASFAPPPSMVTATPSYPPNYNNGAQGSGATHTVWVAPTQGVLRYVPFAVNASVGDTVRFVWGGGPHTVTKGSQFNLCNATKEAPFASGKQNKSFVFDQVVNDTKPTFYYCAVAEHCAKGMFGIINPPNAQPGSQDTVQIKSQVMAQNNSDVAAQWAYMMQTTSNSTEATNWGSNIDMSAITTDPEGQLAIAQNTMFTRIAMAMNAKSITPDGGFNPDGTTLAVPMDISKVTASNAPADSSKAPSDGSNNVGNSPSGTSDASASAPSSTTGGASRRVASSATAVFAAVAIAALVL